MRVLLVHTRYRQAGGEDQVVETEGAALTAAGHEVEYHYLDNPEGTRRALGALARSPWNGSAARRVVDHAQRFGAEVVHVHNTWFSLSPAVFPALRRAGFPTVTTIHNYRLSCVNASFLRDGRICEDCLGRGPWRGVAHACYRDSRVQSAAVAVTISTHRRAGTWGGVDVVVALTRFAADRLAQSGVPPERIVVKPNFVADPGPRPSPPSASHEVLFVGRLTPEKGVPDALAAWRRLDPTAGLSLTVVGDGPLRAEVEAETGVVAVGWCSPSEVRARMLAARALVFPSRWFEGLSLALVEAMACGLPVVVPDLGAMPDVAGGGGIVFRSGDVRSLADAVGSLRDDSEVKRLGRASRLEYEGRFSPGRGLAELEAVYGQALAQWGRLA